MNNCIISNRCKDKDGYAKIWRNGKEWREHRFVYTQHHGPIPRGLVVRHKCDNPSCINIDHLELGTPADNNRDRYVRNRYATNEDNPRSKLTNAQVKYIRDMYKIIAQRTLAKMFNVSNSCIVDIHYKRTYKTL